MYILYLFNNRKIDYNKKNIDYNQLINFEGQQIQTSIIIDLSIFCLELFGNCFLIKNDVTEGKNVFLNLFRLRVAQHFNPLNCTPQDRHRL